MAIAALILGILAAIFGLVPCTAVFGTGIILGILAIIFGILGKKTSHGMALTGLILGIVGAVASIIWIVLAVWFAESAGEDFQKSVDQMRTEFENNVRQMQQQPLPPAVPAE